MKLRGITLAALSTITFSQMVRAADEPLSIKGYVDVQYKMNRGYLDVANGTSVQGAKSAFSVNQGALYFSKSSESGKFFLDLPFRTNTVGTTNNFDFATTQAQAYLENKYDFGLSWRAGQFDTIYGYEGNDTVDLLVARQGLVYAILPVTHTGVLLNYTLSQVTLSLLYGNANQLSAQGATDNPEVGGKVAWSNDSYRASAGYLVNKKDGTYTVGAQTPGFQANQTIDLLAGATFGAFKVDVGYDIITPSQGKALSSTGAVEDRKNTQAIFALGSYEITSTLTGLLRYENVKEDASNAFTTAVGTNGNGSELNRITAGIKHQMNKEMICKAGVNFNTVKVSADSTSKSASYVDGEIAALYSF